MHKKELRKTLGIGAALALFISTLLISAFGSMLLAPPAHALDSGGKATWLTAWTLRYTDQKGHTLTYTETAAGDDGETCWVGWGISRRHFPCTMFNSDESFSQYLSRTRKTNNPDTAICTEGSTDQRASTIQVFDISTNSPSGTETSSGFHIGGGSNGPCGVDAGGSVTFTNARPAKPDPKICAVGKNQAQLACPGTVTWAANSSNIVNVSYTGAASDQILNDLGVPLGQEFDETALQGDTMTFTSNMAPSGALAPCSDMRSYLTIQAYQTNKYAQLFTPQYLAPSGDSTGSCTMHSETWLNVIGAPAAPPKTNDIYSASWDDNASITLSTASGGVNIEMLDWGVINSINDPAPVFTQSSLVNNFMTLSAPSACSSKKSTMQINPYLVDQYVLVTVFNKDCTLARGQTVGQSAPFWVKLTNLNPNSPLGSGSSSNNDTSGNCPVAGALNWIFCPVIDIAKTTIGVLTNVIATLMFTPTDQIFTSRFQSSFNSFRNLGIALLVVGGLVMVASQAMGLEIFAAYTIRKALPRLVIAMILIAISWPLLQFVVTFFNDLGVWANQLLLAAVNADAGGAPLSSYNGLAAGIAVVTAGGAFLFSTGIVVSLLGTVLIALLVGFLVLAIRQLIILICILIAPLAIAAFIFPGTEKLGKFWRESFLTALAAFPIIMAFFGAGEAMSHVAGVAAKSTSGGGSLAWSFLAVLCLAAPPFLLSFALQMAGGLVRTAHAVVSGGKLTKGLSGAMSEYRGKKFAQRGHDAASGHFFRSSGIAPIDAVGGGVNRFMRGAYLFGQNPLSRGQRRAVGANQDMTRALKLMEDDPDIKPGSANEDLYMAGMRGTKYRSVTTGRDEVTDGSEASIRDYYQSKGITNKADLDRMVGQTRLMQRKMGQRSFEIAGAIAAAGSGTGYKGGVGEMLETISRVAGHDKLLAQQMLGQAKRAAGAAQRLDLSGASFTNLYSALQAHMDSNGQTAIDSTGLTLEAMASGDAISNMRARKTSVDNMMGAVSDRLDAIHSTPITGIDPTSIANAQAQERERSMLVAMLQEHNDVSKMTGYTAADRALVAGAASDRNYGDVVGIVGPHGNVVREGVYQDATRPVQPEFGTADLAGKRTPPTVASGTTAQMAVREEGTRVREQIRPLRESYTTPRGRGRGGTGTGTGASPNPPAYGPGGPIFP